MDLDVGSEDALVTFLFTDIEGSTRLWESAAAQMAVALQRHDALMRSAIESNGGAVFKTVGDAFCAAFDSPVAAINAAIRAQRALAIESWPPQAVISVRMAVHTGYCQQRDRDFFGPTVNRVARLLAIGHGGQTLISGVVVDLVDRQLSPTIELLDMGEHRLKDLSRPQRVFEVVLPGRTPFPPLRSLDNPAVRHNLPAQASSFVGRERELADLHDLIKKHRLVTLIGPGGAGKTRLALQATADRVDDFRDGVWFIELAPLSDFDQVMQAVAMTCGVSADPGASLVDCIIEWLRQRDVLLAIDNCEHLLDDVARFVDRVMRACPHANVVVTSRESLGIAGEQRFVVPPLSLPKATSTARASEAVQFLVERAQQHDRTFEVTPANVDAVVSVCRQLDGMPLALELAAARLATMSVDDVAARLSDRFRLLKAGSRAALPRQQTLRALIDWSYELLTPDERVVLLYLTVFPGSWTLTAAEATVGNAIGAFTDVVELHGSLVSKSLIQLDDGRDGLRFRLLETIKAYAVDELESNAPDAVDLLRIAHMNAYLQVVAAVGAGAQDFNTAQTATTLIDLDNIRAALETARQLADPEPGLRLAIGIAACSHALNLGLGPILQELIERTPDIASPLLIDALFWLHFQTFQTDRLASRAQLARALELSIETNDHARIASCLGRQSVYAVTFDGDPIGALGLGNRSLQHAEIDGHPLPTRRALSAIGLAHRELGDLVAARSAANRYLALAREANHLSAICEGLGTVATIDLAEGHLTEARHCLEEALHVAELDRYEGDRGWVLLGLGDVEIKDGRYIEGLRRYQAAIRCLINIDDKWSIGEALRGVSHAVLHLGAPDDSAFFIGASDAIITPLEIQHISAIAADRADIIATATAELGQAKFGESYERGRRLDSLASIRTALDYRPTIEP